MTSQDPMFSVEDIPVNHSARPAKGKAKKTRDTSSPGSPKPFASYDPDTQSWKTFPATSLLGSEPYKASWPRSGMTVDGTAYQLPPSAPRTSATEFSLLLHRGPNSIGLWPTATTEDHATRYSQGGMPLGMAARLWPTVKASDHKAMRIWPIEKTKSRDMALRETIAALDPLSHGGRLNPTWVEWLMGFPIGWTELEDSETPSFHKSPNTSEES